MRQPEIGPSVARAIQRPNSNPDVRSYRSARPDAACRAAASGRSCGGPPLSSRRESSKAMRFTTRPRPSACRSWKSRPEAADPARCRTVHPAFSRSGSRTAGWPRRASVPRRRRRTAVVPTAAAARTPQGRAPLPARGVGQYQGGIGQHGAGTCRQQARIPGPGADERDAAGLALASTQAHLASHPCLPRWFNRSRAPSSNNSAATESPSSRARRGAKISDARITSDPSSVATILHSTGNICTGSSVSVTAW